MNVSRKRNQERVTLSISRELVNAARGEAIKRGSNLSAVVRLLLEMWLADEIKLSPIDKRETRKLG